MLLTQDELAESARPNPEVAAFLHNQPLPPMDLSTHVPMRKALAMFETRSLSDLGPPPSSINEAYHPVVMRDGSTNTVKVVKPASTDSGPLFILVHAGGFVGGSCDQLSREARALVQLFGATVVSVSYRLAPEHKFPTPQLDVWDCCKWASQHATGEVLGANPRLGFILGGVSVGGSMTAALTRKFVDQPLDFPITGQWLSVASLMDDTCVPARFQDIFVARRDSSNAPMLSKASLAALQEWSQWDPSSDLRYAVNSKSDISTQPKTYLQVGAMDPYRDDTLVYDELLREAGVETKVDLYHGCPHLHWMVMPDLDISRRTRIDTIEGLGWLLGKTVDREKIAAVLGMKTVL